MLHSVQLESGREEKMRQWKRLVIRGRNLYTSRLSKLLVSLKLLLTRRENEKTEPVFLIKAPNKKITLFLETKTQGTREE